MDSTPFNQWLFFGRIVNESKCGDRDCRKPIPTPTPTPTPIPTPSATHTPSGFSAGTYLIATGSYVIDDGFYTAYCNYPAAAEVYFDHKPNANQQWHFSACGTGFRICNTINGSSVCLTDGGANGLVDQGQGTDVWSVSAYGGVNSPSGARRLRVRRQLR